MAKAKVLYAVRLPVDLKKLLDSAAESGGVNTSQLVIAACWKYLEVGGGKEEAQTKGKAEKVRVERAGLVTTAEGSCDSLSAVTMNEAMARFLEKVVVEGDTSSEPPIGLLATYSEAPEVCLYKEYDEQTGETMGCGLRAHGPKVKHGKWYRIK